MNDDFNPKAPDFNLAMLQGKQRNPSVGSAWKQADGSISIKLHPGVVIQSGPDVKLRLFPAHVVSDKPPKNHPAWDDDVPF